MDEKASGCETVSDELSAFFLIALQEIRYLRRVLQTCQHTPVNFSALDFTSFSDDPAEYAHLLSQRSCKFASVENCSSKVNYSLKSPPDFTETAVTASKKFENINGTVPEMSQEIGATSKISEEDSKRSDPQPPLSTNISLCHSNYNHDIKKFSLALSPPGKRLQNLQESTLLTPSSNFTFACDLPGHKSIYEDERIFKNHALLQALLTLKNLETPFFNVASSPQNSAEELLCSKFESKAKSGNFGVHGFPLLERNLISILQKLHMLRISINLLRGDFSYKCDQIISFAVKIIACLRSSVELRAEEFSMLKDRLVKLSGVSKDL